MEAADRGLQTCTIRIGQICGGLPNGAWAMNEWIPLLIKSGVALGYLPESHAVGVLRMFPLSLQSNGLKQLVSWVSFDAASRVILEVAFSPQKLERTLGVTHPRALTWEDTFTHISDALTIFNITREPLPLVPFSAWIDKLDEAANRRVRGIERKAVPAYKLIPSLRYLAKQMDENRCRAKGLEAMDASGIQIDNAMAMRTSENLRVLEPLSLQDAERWVRYWKERGFFAEAARL
jgi:thioester reductase-like protein